MSSEPQQSHKVPESSQGTPPPLSSEDAPSTDEWQSELRRKCIVVGKDVDDYIKKVMPDDNITRPELPQYKGGLFRMPRTKCEHYQSKLAGAVVSPLASCRRPRASLTLA